MNTTLTWHRAAEGMPLFNGFFLVAVEDALRMTDEEPAWIVWEAKYFDGVWVSSDGECAMDPSEIVWWTEMPVIPKKQAND